jgi:drug/metabolite transporter (DMT)-like permease
MSSSTQGGHDEDQVGRGKISLMVLGMLAAGTASTLLTKLQDRQGFEQPFWQTFNMFIGELLCCVVYFVLQRRQKHTQIVVTVHEDEQVESLSPQNLQDEYASLLEMQRGKEKIQGWGITRLAVPAMMDLTATTLLNLGLLAVPPSIYQMLRGIVILFTSAYAVAFLRKRIERNSFLGLVVVFAGVALVGASPIILNVGDAAESQAFSEWIGIFLIIGAQAVAAAQFTYEEYLLEKYENLGPLMLVGWEGVFGTIATGIVMMGLFGAARVHPDLTRGKFSVIFNIENGAHQLFSNAILWGCSIGLVFAIAIFNFSGLNVTKHVSAVARTTIDTSRTVLIWAISLGLKWEKFLYVQIFGFLILIYGTFVYNQIIPLVPDIISNACRRSEAKSTEVLVSAAPYVVINTQSVLKDESSAEVSVSSTRVGRTGSESSTRVGRIGSESLTRVGRVGSESLSRTRPKPKPRTFE